MASRKRKVSSMPELRNDRTIKGYGNTTDTGKISSIFNEAPTTLGTNNVSRPVSRTTPRSIAGPTSARTNDGGSGQWINVNRKKETNPNKMFCVSGGSSNMENGMYLTKGTQFDVENKTHPEARQDSDCGYLSFTAGHNKRTKLLTIKDISWLPPTGTPPAEQFHDLKVQMKILQNDKQVGNDETAKQKSAVENCIAFKGKLRTMIKRDCPSLTVSLCVWNTKRSKIVRRKRYQSLGRIDIKLDAVGEEFKFEKFGLYPCEGGELKQMPMSPTRKPTVKQMREQQASSGKTVSMNEIGKTGSAATKPTDNHSKMHWSTDDSAALSPGKPYVRGQKINNNNTLDTKGKFQVNHQSSKAEWTENKPPLTVKNISVQEINNFGICRDEYDEDMQQKRYKSQQYITRRKGSTPTVDEQAPHCRLLKYTATTTQDTHKGMIDGNCHANKEGHSVQSQKIEQNTWRKQSINATKHQETVSSSRTSEAMESESWKTSSKTSNQSPQNTGEKSGHHDKYIGIPRDNTDIEPHTVKEPQSENNYLKDRKTEPQSSIGQKSDGDKLPIRPQTTSNSRGLKSGEIESENSNLPTNTYSKTNTENKSSFQDKNSANTAGGEEKEARTKTKKAAESLKMNTQTKRFSTQNKDEEFGVPHKGNGNTASKEKEFSETKTNETQIGKMDGKGDGKRQKHKDQQNETIHFEHQHTEPKASEVAESWSIKTHKRTSFRQNKEEGTGDNSGRGLKHHRTGIQNLGNTCFANSVLQVLGKTPQLSKSLEGNNTRPVSLLKAIVDELNTDQHHVNGLNVEALLHYVFKRDKSFVLGRQNDSHSFFLSLLNCVNNDSGENAYRLFCVKMMMRFKYSTCSHVEYSNEQLFTSLLMPINNTDTLDGCIDEYCNEETFPDNVLSCRKCEETKSDTVAYKKYVFTELPEILVLQMGRFEEEEGYHKKIIRKKTTRISFEKYVNLNLEQTGDSEKNTKKTKCCYELYGVVDHSGSMAGGHYTATVKMERTDDWYYCSDTYVRQDTSPTEKPDGGAYLLFYHLQKS